MKRSTFVTAAALAFAVSAPLLGMTTAPAFAQDWADDADHEGNWHQDRRERLMDLLQERRDRRSEIMDMLRERRDRRAEIMDMLRERRDRREALADLIRERRGSEGECYFTTRSLSDENRDFLIIVRRRVCPD
ncbi:Spy/CpxP family protein refolding chaperone [Microvirga flocculans]|uniref:Spy/CpxP family protein refolding chaperone n=1 Tax=Microvirga flocculans TaxID=217168 RepID=A0A7W6IEE6_9HYPH|nr:hypothetical protein [Microvirga flocculans]MBB4039626.1 Spy/CpxP family protein refolding chaperone [Microvirga flocculans]